MRVKPIYIENNAHIENLQEVPDYAQQSRVVALEQGGAAPVGCCKASKIFKLLENYIFI